MTDYAAKLLNELMGRNRDLLPEQQNNKLTIDSPEICKYYCVSLCPHDLFTNTRVDLGPCGGIHDDAVKKEYDQLPPHKKVQYEDEFLRYCQTMLNDVERKIKRSKQRLLLQPDDEKLSSLVPPQYSRHEERLNSLTQRITKLVKEVEELGNKGEVEEAQGIMRTCEKLKVERERLRRSTEGSVWHQAAEMAASQEKQMQVCEICGAFLILSDAQQRIDDHLTGKQHLGYAKLKDVVEEIREGREKSKRDQESAREKEREERRSARDTEDRDRVSTASSRERERDRSRATRTEDRAGRSGERERTRHGERESRERRRERSRDRDRTDREERGVRDRERSSRNEPERERERDRSSRSARSRDERTERARDERTERSRDDRSERVRGDYSDRYWTERDDVYRDQYSTSRDEVYRDRYQTERDESYRARYYPEHDETHRDRYSNYHDEAQHSDRHERTYDDRVGRSVDNEGGRYRNGRSDCERAEASAADGGERIRDTRSERSRNEHGERSSRPRDDSSKRVRDDREEAVSQPRVGEDRNGPRSPSQREEGERDRKRERERPREREAKRRRGEQREELSDGEVTDDASDSDKEDRGEACEKPEHPATGDRLRGEEAASEGRSGGPRTPSAEPPGAPADSSASGDD